MEVRFSDIPPGGEFKYQEQVYTRYTYNRGRQYQDGKPIFKNFKKHQIVDWLKPYNTIS